MNSENWIILYEKFKDFSAMAKRIHFYDKTLQEMEYSLFEMCPLPAKWKSDKKPKRENKKCLK